MATKNVKNVRNSKPVKVGAVTYPSLAHAVASYAKVAAGKGKTSPDYMTVYQRVRAGMTVAQALNKAPRAYTKRADVEAVSA